MNFMRCPTRRHTDPRFRHAATIGSSEDWLARSSAVSENYTERLGDMGHTYRTVLHRNWILIGPL